jgi:hypothetical protein
VRQVGDSRKERNYSEAFHMVHVNLEEDTVRRRNIARKAAWKEINVKQTGSERNELEAKSSKKNTVKWEGKYGHKCRKKSRTLAKG